MTTRSPIAGRPRPCSARSTPGDMGITLPHEHLLIDFTLMFKEPEGEPERELARQPVGLDNLGWVRRNFSSSLDNLRLTDESVARDELLLYRAGRRPDRRRPHQPGAVPRPARAGARRAGDRPQHRHGLGLLRGRLASRRTWTGRRWTRSRARSSPTLTVGVGETGVRAGFIGEIGTTWPWTDNERKVVRAAVLAQRETGAPLMIHPGRHERLPLEIVEFIRREGADLGRTIMCHIERTIVDPAVLLELAATGVYLEYDLFGLETSYYPYNPTFDMPNDARAHPPDPVPDRARPPRPDPHVPRHRLQALPHALGRLTATTTSSSASCRGFARRARTTRRSDAPGGESPAGRSCSPRADARAVRHRRPPSLARDDRARAVADRHRSRDR